MRELLGRTACKREQGAVGQIVRGHFGAENDNRLLSEEV